MQNLVEHFQQLDKWLEHFHYHLIYLTQKQFSLFLPFHQLIVTRRVEVDMVSV